MKLGNITLILLFGTSVYAGGWDNSLIGARSAGMGTAFVGIADDASAIYYNAAGLAYAEPRAQFILCGKSYYPTHTFINSAGDKATSEIQATLFEMFTYYHVNERWTLAFGMYTPYAGGGMKWSREKIGYEINGAIGTISFTPTIALKVLPNLSMGLNLNYYHIISHQKVYDPSGGYIMERFELPGGFFEKKNLNVHDFHLNADEKGYEYTFSGSLFYKPNNVFAFGFTYHGKTNVHIKGISKIDGQAEYELLPLPPIPITFLGDYPSGTRFHLPASYALGLSYRILPKVTLSAEYDYYYWSKLRNVEKINENLPVFISGEKINENLPVFISGMPLKDTGLLPPDSDDIDWIYDEPLGFNNSYYLKLGAEYSYTEKMTLRFGTSYDSGKVSQEAYSITNIDVIKYNFLAGIGYKIGMFDFNIAGFVQIGKQEKVHALPFDEKYDLDSMGILASFESSW